LNHDVTVDTTYRKAITCTPHPRLHLPHDNSLIIPLTLPRLLGNKPTRKGKQHKAHENKPIPIKKQVIRGI
jgi:hypothetical protein